MAGQSITNDKSPLWPGYSEMLRGVMGRPPLKPDSELQKRALREWTEGIIKGFNLDDIKNGLTKDVSNLTSNIVECMWKESEVVRQIRDATALEARIRQLSNWDSNRFANEIKETQSQLDIINKELTGKDKDKIDAEYTNILKREPSNDVYNRILKDTGLDKYSSDLTKDQILDIIKAASFCTVTPSTIIPPGLEQARLEVEKLAVEHDFEIPGML